MENPSLLFHAPGSGRFVPIKYSIIINVKLTAITIPNVLKNFFLFSLNHFEVKNKYPKKSGRINKHKK